LKDASVTDSRASRCQFPTGIKNQTPLSHKKTSKKLLKENELTFKAWNVISMSARLCSNSTKESSDYKGERKQAKLKENIN